MQHNIVEKFSSEDVVVFGLNPNSDPYHEIVDYVNKTGITFDMLYNADEVKATYGVEEEPTYVLLDQEGQIRLRADNEIYWYRISELVNIVQQLVGN